MIGDRTIQVFDSEYLNAWSEFARERVPTTFASRNGAKSRLSLLPVDSMLNKLCLVCCRGPQFAQSATAAVIFEIAVLRGRCCGFERSSIFWTQQIGPLRRRRAVSGWFRSRRFERVLDAFTSFAAFRGGWGSWYAAESVEAAG
jgi:hypothetical protein